MCGFVVSVRSSLARVGGGSTLALFKRTQAVSYRDQKRCFPRKRRAEPRAEPLTESCWSFGCTLRNYSRVWSVLLCHVWQGVLQGGAAPQEMSEAGSDLRLGPVGRCVPPTPRGGALQHDAWCQGQITTCWAGTTMALRTSCIPQQTSELQSLTGLPATPQPTCLHISQLCNQAMCRTGLA